eukprot:COSAG01_NODE_1108_length_11662_cov_189.275534_10_plen_408_part_00
MLLRVASCARQLARGGGSFGGGGNQQLAACCCCCCWRVWGQSPAGPLTLAHARSAANDGESESASLAAKCIQFLAKFPGPDRKEKSVTTHQVRAAQAAPAAVRPVAALAAAAPSIAMATERVMTREQIETFKREGAVLLKRFIAPEQLAAWTSEYWDFMGASPDEPRSWPGTPRFDLGRHFNTQHATNLGGQEPGSLTAGAGWRPGAIAPPGSVAARRLTELPGVQALARQLSGGQASAPFPFDGHLIPRFPQASAWQEPDGTHWDGYGQPCCSCCALCAHPARPCSHMLLRRRPKWLDWRVQPWLRHRCLPVGCAGKGWRVHLLARKPPLEPPVFPGESWVHRRQLESRWQPGVEGFLVAGAHKIIIRPRFAPAPHSCFLYLLSASPDCLTRDTRDTTTGPFLVHA